MGFLKKLFGGKKKEEPKQEEFTEEQFEKDYEDKRAGLESVLGQMHELVGHAIIPFSIGGAVDMYYFTHHIRGTGFATMELLDPNGNGPRPNDYGTYELVAFTKHAYNSSDEKTPFNLIERKICGIFTMIGNYSTGAVLNPNETCEIPNGEGEENTCVVFDLYEPGGKQFNVGGRRHHLLLCLQIFRSEMDYARENGSPALFEKMKAAGIYPYSDLDRDPIV